MKQKLIKTFLILCLSAVLVITMTSCAKKEEPQDELKLNNSSPLVGATYSSGYEYYLKLNGIEGECKESQHDKWINVVDFSHGSSQIYQSSVPGVFEDSVFEPFVFIHKVDKATPKIQESCMKGNYITSAQIDVTTSFAGKATLVYSVKMGSILILSAQVYTYTDEAGVSYLMEKVEMLVTKMTWTVNSVGLDNSVSGSTEASYDQSKKA